MEFSATIELSAPKDLAKMYNFVSEKFNDQSICDVIFLLLRHRRLGSSPICPEMISTSSSAEESLRREEVC